ncbi:MAG: hypothetical protein C4617_05610 [Candidatus Liberibacter europaeus]|uniref:Uncharacterized protein n=1 Tax=Candidatus Liberibacter europaeus TaxID=744859 RepID=A0A2T4VW75_9HYPH|nr:hypothetical protein [Candidatus Liberibacter europaeus]PTL86032.1 MAG: hypothetical protein C4617_05610 [Candidatus Liberibacter europaeus]
MCIYGVVISCSFLFAGCFSYYASPTKHSISIIGSVLESMNDSISEPSKLITGSYVFKKPLKNNVDLRGQLCITKISPPRNNHTI